MHSLSAIELSTSMRLVCTLLLTVVCILGSIFLSTGLLALALLIVACVMFATRIVEYGRLAKTFIVLGAISYTVPAIAMIRLHFASQTQECINSGPVLCTSQVAGQLTTLPFYLGLTLSVQLLASISVAEWLYLIVQLEGADRRCTDFSDLLKDLIKASATSIHDFENVARARLNGIAVLQRSFKLAGVNPRKLYLSLRLRLRERISLQKAEIETFGATGLELFLSLVRTSVTKVPKGYFEAPHQLFSRYEVDTLRHFYEAYSMSSAIHQEWVELLGRVVGSGMRVADVGSGNGRLLHQLSALQASVDAYEPDLAFKSDLDKAISFYAAGSIAVFYEAFAARKSGQVFDVVVLMNNVLVEMIGDSDPSLVLADLVKAIKPSGILVFDYPDRSAIDVRGSVDKHTSSNSNRLKANFRVKCGPNIEERVDADCTFSFAKKETGAAERTEGRLNWRELVHWYPLSTVESILRQHGMNITSKTKIDVRTVIPSEMFLYECVRRGEA